MPSLDVSTGRKADPQRQTPLDAGLHPEADPPYGRNMGPDSRSPRKNMVQTRSDIIHPPVNRMTDTHL